MTHESPFRRRPRRRPGCTTPVAAPAACSPSRRPPVLAALGAASPAGAALRAPWGPVVPRHGFPDYYQDASGLRLTLCVERGPVLLERGAEPRPGDGRHGRGPVELPGGDVLLVGRGADRQRTVGVRARLVLAREAAFAGDAPAAGDRVTFARIRVTIDGAQPGADYTVTHPYGTEHLTADRRGRVRMTDDVGCAGVPCDFADALATRIGPFLGWDPNSPPVAPAGYVGNPLREHTVVGARAAPRSTCSA
jgi:hypothetical protein